MWNRLRGQVRYRGVGEADIELPDVLTDLQDRT